ncbi:MAG: response regulator transcription factor [Lachnospiraceae bacterium]|nr:response regulator transcription factor [Lachnospiraceae bacterium]
MKIAICDDYLFYRDLLTKLVQKYDKEKNCNLSVDVYERGDKLIEEALRIGGYDIYILDIMMPGIDGIELGLVLREHGLNGKIMYLTSSEDYAVDAFKARAFNYILKPIEKNTFFNALDEVINLLNVAEEKSFIIKTKDGSVRLDYNNILYVDLDKRALTFHLLNDQTVRGNTIRITFAEAVHELLQDNRFVLCGASMAVNLQHITMVESDSLLFQDNSNVYISKRAIKELLPIWHDFSSTKGKA